MKDFIYYAPTKVIFGKEKHKDIGNIIKEYGYKNIMLQYGQGSIKKSGLYDEIMASLKESGINVVEMGGVEPNPKLSFVREAVKVAKENNVEMILAVGGGSVLDSSKYTAAGACADCDPWDFPTGKNKVENALPVGCILTIAAAGSEMSSSAVITNMELNMKRGFNSEFNRCKFAIMNPELTYSVSKYQTACGVVDIMAHTMERYFMPCEPTDLTDRIAESVLKAVISAGTTLMENPEDYEAKLEHIQDYFKGDFSELKSLVALMPENKIKVMFGVRTANDGKQYQTTYSNMVLSNRTTDYSKLDADLQERKSNGAFATTEFSVCDFKEFTVEPTTFEENKNNDNPFDDWQ